MGEQSEVPTTEVKANARLELLRLLALMSDIDDKEKAKAAAKGDPCYWPDWVPLFAGEWENQRHDIRLAAKECAAFGHIELTMPSDHFSRMMYALDGPPVRITDAGYDWIRAHDAIGEAQQERPCLTTSERLLLYLSGMDRTQQEKRDK